MIVNYYKYRLPFAAPFLTSKSSFNYREGIIIACISEEFQYYGEAAPLPGYSKETLADVQQLISENKEAIENILRNKNPVDGLQNLYKDEEAPASLQFGLDSIAYQIQAHHTGKNLYDYLFSGSPKPFPVNALVSLQSDDYLSEVEKQISEGFQTIKFKIGINFGLEFERLQNIRSKFTDVTIRLDANQAWPIDEAISKCQQLESLDIEYCEEPLNNPSPKNFETLTDQTKLPLALDESIYQISGWQNLLSYTLYLILKPMILGSFTKIFETKRLADTHDNKGIFTTSLESGIGRTITAILAAGEGASNTAQGLATGKLLAKDVQSDIPYIAEGFYNTDGLSDQPGQISDQLYEVSSKLF